MKELLQHELTQIQALLGQVNLEHLEAAATLIQNTPGKLIMIGNGGSNAIASHMAEDYTNNYKTALCCSDTAMLSCFANDYGWDQAFVIWLKHFSNPGDSIILISSSGASQNMLNCATWATEHQYPLITLSGFQTDNPLRQHGNVSFYVSSQSYKDVEIMHLTLLHTILETLMKLK